MPELLPNDTGRKIMTVLCLLQWRRHFFLVRRDHTVDSLKIAEYILIRECFGQASENNLWTAKIQ